jgi:ATP-dependent Lon protease
MADEDGSPEGRLPLLPLRELVVFPGMTVPLIVGRPRSRAALLHAWEGSRRLVLSAQRSGEAAEPGPDGVHAVGTTASMLQLLRLPDDNLKVLLKAEGRVRWSDWSQTADHVSVAIEPLEDGDEVPEGGPSPRMTEVREAFAAFARGDRGVPPEMMLRIDAIEQPGRLADTIVGHLPGFKLDERQRVLELIDPHERLERVLAVLRGEVEVQRVEQKIKRRVRKQMEGSEKEFFLNDQMQAIQKDLGEKDEYRAELAAIEGRIRDAPLTAEARARLERELRKLRMMSPMSAEAAVLRNYIDEVLALPWQHYVDESVDLREAARILDEDHHGLERVKERIVEQLAVATLVERPRGPVLCLVGPPGVGKTSLARSIARATGREFVRQALGGVRDEAEIRGHRRTYIGAMPGKIIRGFKKAGTSNPVFLLDEIDKMTVDVRGDPGAALLEVLDPEQNATFLDHYLDLDYDLGRVLFICTANELSAIPAPLRDRLELIRLPGYTQEEKLAIARRYLLPRQLEANGVSDEQLQVDDPALVRIIREYTRESGVRGFERELARLARKVARRIVEDGPEVRVVVDEHAVSGLLGVPRHAPRPALPGDQVGLVHGLAVTPWGGEVLEIEVAVLPGKGKLTLTGRLGDWLKESGTAGWTYLRSRSAALGLAPDLHENVDVHVHYPGNSLRTDGPSAGIAMAAALASALTGRPVRGDLAMTGEISLRGRVLPIGGLKEKLLAAARRGLEQVVIPHANTKDLEDVPEEILARLQVHPVRHMDEVLGLALRSDPGAEE